MDDGQLCQLRVEQGDYVSVTVDTLDLLQLDIVVNSNLCFAQTRYFIILYYLLLLPRFGMRDLMYLVYIHFFTA